jgi:hypothetical protein
MWLLLPVAGMAASVAMALGVTTMLKFGSPSGNDAGNELASAGNVIIEQPLQVAAPTIKEVPQAESKLSATHIYARIAVNHKSPHSAAQKENKKSIGLSLNAVMNAKSLSTAHNAEQVNLASIGNVKPAVNASKKSADKKEEPVTAPAGYRTFRKNNEVAQAHPAKLSIILMGGLSQGVNNSGYTAGATIRRAVNDKVYVEGDVAFTSNNSSQLITNRTETYVTTDGGQAGGAAKPGVIATGARVSGDTKKELPIVSYSNANMPYNLYYAEFTPSLGYRIMKKMSVAAGPDFQQALADNRPAPSTTDPHNIQVAPLFDVGFIGKTEYAITKTVKAAVCYRKGINNVITPADKYIDRNYLQFQVKCAILNR